MAENPGRFEPPGRLSGNSLLSPCFLVCAMLLVAAGMGLRPGMAVLAKRFEKISVPLRKPLDQFDKSKLRSFQPVPLLISNKLNLDEAGARQLLLDQFMPRDTSRYKDRLTLFVTYYSDPKDKVPHVPEVCYRQGPTTIERLTNFTIDTPELGPRFPRTDIRLVILRQPHASGLVLYLFYANGQFYTHREQVRWSIKRPGERYVYFSKIEVITQTPPDADPAPAIEAGIKLLHEALPVLIGEHFPDQTLLK